MIQPTLFIVCGLPGSGKTTRSREIAAATGALRLCPDEWMTDFGIDLYDEPFREALERRFWDLARQLLANGTSAILESGSWVRAERDEWRQYARSVNARVELHYLAVPFDELLRRVRHRAASEGGPRVAESDLRAWWTVFQPPSAEELALYDRLDPLRSSPGHSSS